MRTKTIVAVILIALGIVAFAYQGITYTTRGHEMNIGSMHVSTDRTHTMPLPPILGAIALVGGLALLAADKWGGPRTATR